MSYGFEMGFCSASSFPKALEKAQKVVQILGEFNSATKYIEENLIYSPVRRGPSFSKEDADYRKTKLYARLATDNWVRSMLAFRFVYFEDLKLLGMLWDHRYPKELKKIFKTVYFQNSCDQDYERDDWNKIKPFVEIYDECMKLDASTFCDEFTTLEDVEKSLDYYRRTAAYDKIFEVLNLDKWLYGNPAPNLKRFSLNAIEISEDMWRVQEYVRNLFLELKD
jgi:hypothetical protein